MAKVVGHGVTEYQPGTPVALPLNVDQIDRIQIMLDTVKGQPAEAELVDRYLGPATGLELKENGKIGVAEGCTVAANGDIIVPDERKAGIQHPEYYTHKQ